MRVYEDSVRRFLAFNFADAKLTKDAVIGWMASMAEAEPSSIRLRLAALKQFAKWLAAETDFNADAILLIRPPRLDQKPVPALSDDEVNRLLKACNGKDWQSRRDRAIVSLMTETGLRAGELLALEVDDVNLTECVVTVMQSKTGKGRRSKFSASTAAAVDRYKRSALVTSGPLWRSNRGRLSYTGLLDAMRRRATQAGIADFHPHRLRHTAAVRWLAKGGSESGLMSQAGWADRAMVDRYVRASKEQLAADEFDRLRLDLDPL